MADLFKLLEKYDYHAVAIVGMTKNVGKTVTLNYLVKKYEEQGRCLGLVSAGYDGERFDRLTLEEKPRIYTPQGAFLATARACFEAAEAQLELIEETDLSTPLGPVYLARVKDSGLVEMAGPGSVSGLKKLLNKMMSFGAERVLVDGAINRIASASPDLTEGIRLAAGAALGPTMDDVVQKTVFRKALLETTPVADKQLYQAASQGLSEGKAAVINRNSPDGGQYEVKPINAEIPLLAARQALEQYSRETEAIAYGGALVDSTMNSILKLDPPYPAVIVKDATKIFISAESYNRYISRGGQLQVLKKLNLAAVTLNPTDPGGRGYDPRMFLESMREALRPCPVFDLIYEGNL